MIKNLLIAYLFTISSVMAGLPPTTLKGQSQTTKPTTFNFQVPNKQATITAASTGLIETGNNNELENRGFEHSTVSTGWTITNATASANTANPLEGKKSLSLALTGALSLSQSSTINASQKSGVQMVASIWVNSSDVSDLQLCSLKNGSEDKCTVTGGYVQGTGWKQLTVSFLGNSTSNGLKLKSTDTTGTVLVDQAFVGLGSPIVDFTPDMVYSAKVSSAGDTSDENTDWILSSSRPSTGTYNINLVSGVFNQSPNCVATTVNTAAGYPIAEIQSASSAQIVVIIRNNGSGSNLAFNLICQKQGADYKTSKAYVASSSDFGYTNAGAITITATTTNPTKGTVVTDRVFVSRNGQRLKAIYQYKQSTTGSAGSGDYIISLPSGLSFNTGVITPYTGSLTASADYSGSIVGYGQVSNGNATTTHGMFRAVAYSSTSFRMVGMSTGTGSSLTVAHYPFGSSWLGIDQTALSFNIDIDAPIQGWTDSGVIVGSFQGYNETPGTSRVETFSVSYGTTNATTVCSASPCSYLDQIGNAVTSVTRSGTGAYSLNTSKTYSKLKCIATVGAPGSGYLLSPFIGANNGQCLNCSSVTFTTVNNSGTATDSNGTLVCQGIPQ